MSPLRLFLHAENLGLGDIKDKVSDPLKTAGDVSVNAFHTVLRANGVEQLLVGQEVEPREF